MTSRLVTTWDGSPNRWHRTTEAVVQDHVFARERGSLALAEAEELDDLLRQMKGSSCGTSECHGRGCCGRTAPGGPASLSCPVGNHQRESMYRSILTCPMPRICCSNAFGPS